MERNDFPTGPGSTDSTNTNTTGASFGGSAPTGNIGNTGSTVPGSSSETVTDRARSLASDAGDQLADVGDTVRDRAGTMKTGLADALESGADRLRNRGDSTMVAAGATAAGSIGVSATSRESELTDRVASGMQSSADWLRDIDLDGLKTSLEQQAKEHPGRTLLIAAGLGYLVGKAFRK